MSAMAPTVCGLLAFWCSYLFCGGNLRGSAKHAALWLGEMAAKVCARLGANRTGGRRERRVVVREMPTFLDIVTLGLSAGLSFDASLELYCARYDTRLSHAMAAALMSWRIGARERGEALFCLARDVGAPSLERFAATVDEALSFGSPLAEVLTRQAQAIRDEQRAEIEEEIERAPVKMLIPLGTLIVPAMLLSILGPLLTPALGTG